MDHAEQMFYHSFGLRTPDCPGCRERDSTIAALARTAGEYFARWIWTLKVLEFMLCNVYDSPRNACSFRPFYTVAQDSLEARGQFDVANRPQRIDDAVELHGRDDEVQAIGIDIELTLTIRIRRLLGWHDGRDHRSGRCSSG